MNQGLPTSTMFYIPKIVMTSLKKISDAFHYSLYLVCTNRSNNSPLRKQTKCVVNKRMFYLFSKVRSLPLCGAGLPHISTSSPPRTLHARRPLLCTPDALAPCWQPPGQHKGEIPSESFWVHILEHFCTMHTLI